jgi:hypothetical protein
VASSQGAGYGKAGLVFLGPEGCGGHGGEGY